MKHPFAMKSVHKSQNKHAYFYAKADLKDLLESDLKLEKKSRGYNVN